MAIYHFSCKILSRANRRSGTAAAAYRAGELVVDARTGEIFDYTRKRGVLHSAIVMPMGSVWQPTRSELWNAVEAKNKRADAQVAREFVVALPVELGFEQQRELVELYASRLATGFGICVDIAIHAPSGKGDSRNGHAHLLTTTNTCDGFKLGNKQRELDPIAHNQNKKRFGTENAMNLLRQGWQDLCNQALARANSSSRIDCRTLAAQGIDRIPQVHLGPAVTGKSRRGEQSDVLDRIAAEAAEVAAEAAALADELELEDDEEQAQLDALWERRRGIERGYELGYYDDEDREAAMNEQVWLEEPKKQPGTTPDREPGRG